MSSLLTALLLIREITGFESRFGHSVPGMIILVILTSSPKKFLANLITCLKLVTQGLTHIIL